MGGVNGICLKYSTFPPPLLLLFDFFASSVQKCLFKCKKNAFSVYFSVNTH